jgi:hypothetical protein
MMCSVSSWWDPEDTYRMTAAIPNLTAYIRSRRRRVSPSSELVALWKSA